MLVCFVAGGHSYRGRVCKICGFLKKTPDQKEKAVSSFKEVRAGDKVKATHTNGTVVTGAAVTVDQYESVYWIRIAPGVSVSSSSAWEVEIIEPAYKLPEVDGLYVRAGVDALSEATIFTRRQGLWGSSLGDGDQLVRAELAADQVKLVRLVRAA